MSTSGSGTTCRRRKENETWKQVRNLPAYPSAGCQEWEFTVTAATHKHTEAFIPHRTHTHLHAIINRTQVKSNSVKGKQ